MAKKKKTAKKRRRRKSGPYLSVATLCQAVVEEKDSNFTTLFRLIDGMNLTGEGSTLPPGVIKLTLYLSFKSESAGKSTVAVDIRNPSGKVEETFEREVQFQDAPEKGSAFNITLTMGIKEAGVYWFDTYLDGSFVTSIPLHVSYRQRSVRE